MEHRPKPQRPEQISALDYDPETIELLARRIQAALFAAKLGSPFEEEIIQPFVNVADRELWCNLLRDLLDSVVGAALGWKLVRLGDAGAVRGEAGGRD